MFVRLDNEVVADSWDKISRGIIESIWKTEIDYIAVSRRLLEGVLSGELQCWAGFEDSEVDSVIITMITYDYYLGKRVLLVYLGHVFSEKAKDIEVLRSRIEVLKAFALGNGCTEVGGYCADVAVFGVIKELGAKVDSAYVSIIL